MPAIDSWRTKVQAHHDQSMGTQEQSAWSADDFWVPIVAEFKADPHRTDDPVIERIRHHIGADGTVIDVGGGAGRFALPLALRCKHVTVVEPSESMIQALRDDAREADIPEPVRRAGALGRGGD